MSLDTIVFVLAAIAVLGGVGLSLMFAANANSRSHRLQMTWEMSKPAKLALEVADLAAALDANKRATRSELGKLWQKFAKIEFFETEVDEPVFRGTPPPICENWLTAQNPNLPGWKQARDCDCAYCLTQREARRTEKAAILVERSRAKANGSE